MIDYTTHNMEKKKYKNLKGETIELYSEDTCVNLYRVINEDTSGNPVYVDENGMIYNSIYNFKEADLFEKIIVCKEEKWNRYKLLMEEFLEISKNIFHGDQHFKDEHRLIEHCYSKENIKLKFNTLIETNI